MIVIVIVLGARRRSAIPEVDHDAFFRGHDFAKAAEQVSDRDCEGLSFHACELRQRRRVQPNRRHLIRLHRLVLVIANRQTVSLQERREETERDEFFISHSNEPGALLKQRKLKRFALSDARTCLLRTITPSGDRLIELPMSNWFTTNQISDWKQRA